MSAASTTATLPDPPDPTPDPAAANAQTQSRTGRLLGFIRKLIDYGTELAHSMRHQPTLAALATVTLHFGTRDMALILARITRGLQLAGGLQAKLASRPLPETKAPAAVRAPPERKPRTARRAPRRPALPNMPTAEEIAAAVRHRPAGAVIADICRDLGIVPAHPLWREAMAVVTEFRGNLSRFFLDTTRRVLAWCISPAFRQKDEWAERWLPAVAAGATGPP